MTTLVMLLIAIVCYSIFGLFVAKTAGKLDDYLANGVFNGVASLLPMVVFLVFSHKHSQSFTRQGFMYSVVAGVFLTVFSVLVLKVFARGGNLAYVMPVVYGGMIAVSSLLGWLVLKESIAPLQLAGIICILVGVSMVVIAKL